MLLENKNVIVYGGGGAVGGAVARAMARDGATVFLAGRTLAQVRAVAGEISAGGGTAHVAQVDALDEQAIARHAAGLSPSEYEATMGSGNLMNRLPLLAEVANAATLLASDRASAMTAVLANVTCGSFVDL